MWVSCYPSFSTGVRKTVDETLPPLLSNHQHNCARLENPIGRFAFHHPKATDWIMPHAGSCPAPAIKRIGQAVSRLTKMPSRMTAAPSRIPRAQGEPARDRLRNALRPWRKWYKTKRWAELRSERLKLKGWRCERTGVLLVRKAPAPDSPVLDHIVAHRGDPKLFWDRDNLQVVSKKWHDTVKQKQERAAH
jgi:5-methylcytosine-specific restriction endonuclease McrA